jgi:hypothetical protein
MIQKYIVISMIAPVTVVGILMLAILAAISSTNQTFGYSSYHKAYYKGHHGYYKSSKYTKREGNIRGSESVTTGNEAQGISNTRQGGPSGQTSVGNVVQGGTSSQAGHCKPTVALSAQWYPPYRNYMIRGILTCGGSGLSGKTITLTSSKLSYIGALGTVVTTEDGSFSKSYKPASTAKPLTTVSAWFLGGPDEGGIASKVVTPQGGPQSSNAASTSQESTNPGNAAQGGSNTGNGATSHESTNPGNAAQGGSNTATIQVKCTTGYIWLPSGGFRHCTLGTVVNAPQGSSSTHPGLKTES